MRGMELYLISPFDGSEWRSDELCVGPPFRRIRQLLGGGWERKAGLLDRDMAMAAIRGERRVLVLRFLDGISVPEAEAIVANINADRLREAMS